jgi:hypothetical protein
MARTARTLLTGALGLGILAAWLIGAAEPAGACLCDVAPYGTGSSDAEQQARDDLKSFARADAIFTGEVQNTWAPTLPGSRPSGEVTFDVDQVFEGEVHEEQEIVTDWGRTSCGIAIDEGRSYLVFAYSSSFRPEPLEPGHYSTNMCSGTRVLAGGVPGILGPPHPPIPDPPGPGVPWAAGAVGLLVGTAAGLSLAAAVRHRRSPDHPA